MPEKYKVTDILLLICIILTIIYLYYIRLNRENLVYTRYYNNIKHDEKNGLVPEIESYHMKENDCKEKCNNSNNCIFYKITNKFENNNYNDFSKDNTIEGVCTLYKGINYNRDNLEIEKTDENLNTYLYEKIFRLYSLKNYPGKGLIFIPYTYEKGKLKSLIFNRETNEDELENYSKKSSKSNLSYFTNVIFTKAQNLIKNTILDFRVNNINSPISMKNADTNIKLNNNNSWIFAITFMVSKNSNNRNNIIIEANVTTGSNLIDQSKIPLLYVNKDNRLFIFNKEILNTNSIYTVAELDSSNLYPIDIEEKDQYITLILENIPNIQSNSQSNAQSNTQSNIVNIYYKTLYENNINVKYHDTIQHNYSSIELENIGGTNSNVYYGVIKNILFSLKGINNNLKPLNCNKLDANECNNTIGCINKQITEDYNLGTQKKDNICVKMKDGECINDKIKFKDININATGTDISNIEQDKKKDYCKNYCKIQYNNAKMYSINEIKTKNSHIAKCYCGNKLPDNAKIIKCDDNNYNKVYTLSKSDDSKLTLDKIFDILKTETIEYNVTSQEID